MSKEFMSHMFLPFDRDENASNEQGTGLGLAIVKSVVTLMNGSIDVKSELNHGSEFIVILPLEIADAQDNNIAENSKNISKQLKGKHILLAEDNRINTLVAVRLLESEGIIVETAENGKIAIEKFEQSPVGTFDAILMDIRMPQMNGWEAASAIRQLSRDDAKTVPIIAMTANAYEEDRQKSMDMGMNAHIAKPIEPDVMFGELYKYICEKNSEKNE